MLARPALKPIVRVLSWGALARVLGTLSDQVVVLGYTWRDDK